MNIKTKSGKQVKLNEKTAAIKTLMLCNVILEAQADILSKLNKTTYEKEYAELTKKYDKKASELQQKLA